MNSNFNIKNDFNMPTQQIISQNQNNIKQQNNKINNYNQHNNNNMNYNMNNQNNFNQRNNMSNSYNQQNNNNNMNYNMNNQNNFNQRNNMSNSYNQQNNNNNMNYNMNNQNNFNQRNNMSNSYNQQNNNNNMNYNMNNYNYNQNNNIYNELRNKMIKDYDKMFPNCQNPTTKENFVKILEKDYMIMENIIEEIDSCCNLEKGVMKGVFPAAFYNNCWKNFTYENQLLFKYFRLDQNICDYFNTNKQRFGNYGSFNFLKNKYLNDRSYNDYIKKYGLTYSEYLELRIANSIMFYSYLRLLLEGGGFLNNFLELSKNLNSNEIELAKLVFNNKELNTRIYNNMPCETNIREKFIEMTHEKIAENTNWNCALNLKSKLETLNPYQNFNKNQNFNYNNQAINMNYNQNFFNNQQMMNMNMNKNFNLDQPQQMNYNFRAVNTKSPEELDTQIQGTANTIIAERYQIEQDARKYGTPKIKLYFEECLKLLEYFEKSSKNKLSDSILVHIRTNLGKLSANYDDQTDRIEKHKLYHEITPAMIRKYVILRYLKESDDLEVRKKIISELTSESMWANNYKHIFNHYQQNTQKLILKSFVSDITKLCKNI